MNINNIKNNTNRNFINIIEYYQQLNSTHIFAKQTSTKLKEKISRLIITENQSNGIGTNGKKWYSEPYKNIMMTLLIFPNCNISKFKNFTIEIATCIKTAIKDLYNCELNIKEPNDLLINNKKICGILTEAKTLGVTVKELYISIGFNVNQELFPEEIINVATSLKKELKQDFIREDIIAHIINNLEILIKKLLFNT